MRRVLAILIGLVIVGGAAGYVAANHEIVIGM